MTFDYIYNEAVRTLEKAGVPNAALDAWYLLSYAFGIDRARWLLVRHDPVTDEQKADCFRRLTALRAERVPLQQITGTQDFMGLTFRVHENVLIPRQDTETLVEALLRDVSSPAVSGAPIRLLDMCTGSGCIGISAAALLGAERADVTLADISEAALAAATENIKLNGVKANCRAVRSDLFAAFDGQFFDVIACNPPYIKTADIPGLMPEVKDHEPHAALDGGADGLSFYRRIGEEAPACLAPAGSIYLEIGCSQAREVTEILSRNGFKDIEVIKDMCGHDRVVRARI